MTGTTCQVADCGIRVDGYVCNGHVDELRRDLGDLPALLAELVTTLTRTDRISRGIRRQDRRDDDVGPATVDNCITGEAMPDPVNWGASFTADSTHAILVAWVRTIIEDKGITDWAADTDQAMALWLEARARWVVTSDEGSRMVDEITDMARQLRRAIDRPAVRWFSGPCRAELADRCCVRDLYAKPGAAQIRCDGWHQDGDGCRTTHTAGERHYWLIAHMQDALLPLNDILDALPVLGLDRPDRRTVWSWVHRGQLLAHGSTATAELFRGGDVVELLSRLVVRPKRRRLAA